MSNIGFNKIVPVKWTKVEEVATGETFTIQPLLDNVSYIISETQPDESVRGGVIPKFKQYFYSKGNGDFYIRDFDGLDYKGHNEVYIGKVQE